jgi:signal transduction histidine kinase
VLTVGGESMIAVYFVYGLSFFGLGLAVLLETRRSSDLPLGKHLVWLAAFGFTHSTVEWIDMFLQIDPLSLSVGPLTTLRSILLPLSAILLVRFGIGLINEAGPLPAWLTFLPIVLLVPLALLVSYAIIVSITQPPLEIAADVWSRYLLYFPGNLLAAYGFFRQWQGLLAAKLVVARRLLLGAAVAFLFNAFFAGLIVLPVPYALLPWLNTQNVLARTGVPVQIWRMASALALTIFVVRALNVFEAEREQQVRRLQAEREQAQADHLVAQEQARRSAENWIAALVSVNRQIAALENVDAILVELVRQARDLLKADAATLGLWSADRSILLVKAYALADRVEHGLSLPVHFDLIKSAARERAPRCTRFETKAAKVAWRCPVLGKDVQSAVIVSLCLNEEPLGAFWLTRVANDPFSELDMVRLAHLADQAVIAIEHAMLMDRLQSLAVIEERGRIAREMHDGLAQVLGYLSLETQTLEALVKQGNLTDTLAELRRARVQINEAQADVRENILSLRTTLADHLGLMAGLRQYVEAFGTQTGINVQLVSEPSPDLSLSSLAEAQLVRIVQEALTNVRKHSRAQHAQIRLNTRAGRLCVSICDDGVGFDATLLPRGHFGLQTMRERAESVGGGMTITSHPNEGTQIEVWLPLLGRQN